MKVLKSLIYLSLKLSPEGANKIVYIRVIVIVEVSVLDLVARFVNNTFKNLKK